ncbi:MAG: amino acid-binding protein [Aquificota bacterium]|nr:MAG: amino acid-binding protein [Aquificota bacterium]
MKFFILSIFGKDKPGIVASLSRVLFELGLNLEDSSMTRLKGEFTIMLTLSSDDESLGAEDILKALKPVEKELGLFVVCKELKDLECQPVENLYRIVVFGKDKKGIVYSVSSLLASLGINISDLRTEKRGDLYVMVIEGESAEDMYESLRAGLEALKESLGVDISLEKEEGVEM